MDLTTMMIDGLLVTSQMCFGKECFKSTSIYRFNGLGNGSNNYEELMALLLLLRGVVERNASKVQVFRDTMFSIN
jgi:hypothetical protein